MSYHWPLIGTRPNHGHSCSVPGCVTKEKVSMYNLPKGNEEVRLKWLNACKIGLDDKRKKLWICEKHFSKTEDYKETKKCNIGKVNMRFLKTGAVPRCNLPSEYPGKKKIEKSKYI